MDMCGSCGTHLRQATQLRPLRWGGLVVAPLSHPPPPGDDGIAIMLSIPWSAWRAAQQRAPRA